MRRIKGSVILGLAGVLSIFFAVILTCFAASPRPLELVVAGDLPFPKDDLIDLVRLRLPLANQGTSGPTRLALVRGLGGNRVLVRVGDRSREASIQEKSGVSGARLVALLLVDLASDDDRMALPSAVATKAVHPVERQRGLPRVSISVSTRASFLTHDNAIGVEPMLDLGLRISRSLWVWGEAGYTYTPTRFNYTSGAAAHSGVWFHEIPIRTGLAYRRSWFEARAGLLLRYYDYTGYAEIGSTVQSIAEKGLLPGSTFSIRAGYPLSGKFFFYGTLGFDVLFMRENLDIHSPNTSSTTTRFITTPVCKTNWVSPWVGLGVAFQFGT